MLLRQTGRCADMSHVYCQECEENMVLEIFQPYLLALRLFLLWWYLE